MLFFERCEIMVIIKKYYYNLTICFYDIKREPRLFHDMYRCAKYGSILLIKPILCSIVKSVCFFLARGTNNFLERLAFRPDKTTA